MQFNTLGPRDSTEQTVQNPTSREQELELKLNQLQEIFDKKCEELNGVIKAQNTVIGFYRNKIEKLEIENKPKQDKEKQNLNQIDSLAKAIKPEMVVLESDTKITHTTNIEPTRMRGTEITLFKVIPNLVFKEIKQDEFKAEVAKDIPRANIQFKDNQISIRGLTKEVKLIMKKFDSMVSKIRNDIR